MSTKTIRLKNATYDKLAALGSVGETFDDVVSRLLENGRVLGK